MCSRLGACFRRIHRFSLPRNHELVEGILHEGRRVGLSPKSHSIALIFREEQLPRPLALQRVLSKLRVKGRYFVPSRLAQDRLRLTLGEKLQALGQDADALENYQSLLRENPDYPNPVALYQKLLPLAQKLGKAAEAAKYESLIRELAPPPATTNKQS